MHSVPDLHRKLSLGIAQSRHLKYLRFGSTCKSQFQHHLQRLFLYDPQYYAQALRPFHFHFGNFQELICNVHL